MMKRTPRIESDTPITPRAVAEAALEEASVWLGVALPRCWVRELTARANTVYAHNSRFRQRVRGDSNRGRDWLWMFTRHWLCALVYEGRPHLHRRLPASYNIGDALPPKPVAPVRGNRKPFRHSGPARSAPVAEQGWAAAAHFHWM